MSSSFSGAQSLPLAVAGVEGRGLEALPDAALRLPRPRPRTGAFSALALQQRSMLSDLAVFHRTTAIERLRANFQPSASLTSMALPDKSSADKVHARAGPGPRCWVPWHRPWVIQDTGAGAPGLARVTPRAGTRRFVPRDVCRGAHLDLQERLLMAIRNNFLSTCCQTTSSHWSSGPSKLGR